MRAGQGLAAVRAWVSGPRRHTERPRNKTRSHRPDRGRTGQACGVRTAKATGHVGTGRGAVRRVVRGTDSVSATIAVNSVLLSPRASANWASVVFAGHEPLSGQRLCAAVVPAGPMKAGRDGRRGPEGMLFARRAPSGATTHQRMPAGRFLQGATAVPCGSQATSGCRRVEGRPSVPGRSRHDGRVFAIRPAAGALGCAAGSYRPASDVGIGDAHGESCTRHRIVRQRSRVAVLTRPGHRGQGSWQVTVRPESGRRPATDDIRQRFGSHGPPRTMPGRAGPPRGGVGCVGGKNL